MLSLENVGASGRGTYSSARACFSELRRQWLVLRLVTEQGYRGPGAGTWTCEAKVVQGWMGTTWGSQLRSQGSLLGSGSPQTWQVSFLTKQREARDCVSFLAQPVPLASFQTMTCGSHAFLCHPESLTVVHCFLGSTRSFAHSQCSPKTQIDGHTAELRMSPKLTHLPTTVPQRCLSVTSKITETCAITKI